MNGIVRNRFFPGLLRARAVSLGGLAIVLVFGCFGLPATAGELRGHPAPKAVEVDSAAIRLPGGDEADVYFPSIAPRLRRLFEHSLPPVALLQGANVDKTEYSAVARTVSRHGFIVVVPNHRRAVPPFPGEVLFAEVNTVDEVLAAMVAASEDPASPLYRMVDTRRMGLIGHSLGGSVGLYATAGLCVPQICSAENPASYVRPPALRAAVFYGANLVEAGEVTDLDTSGVAVALVQGELDGIAPPNEAERTYPTLEQPRALVKVEGANHYAICDDNNPAGARPDPVAPTLRQDVANATVGAWMGLWLRAHLLRDPLARFHFFAHEANGQAGGAAGVTSD